MAHYHNHYYVIISYPDQATLNGTIKTTLHLMEMQESSAIKSMANIIWKKNV